MNEFYINQLKGLQEEMDKIAHILMQGGEIVEDDDLRIELNGKTFRIQFSADVYEGMTNIIETELKDLR